MKYILKFFKLCFVIIFIFLLSINLILLFSKYTSKEGYPKIWGYTYFEVLSGSMRDEINIGDIVIIKLASGYDVGDVITYKSNNNFITHRIVEIRENKIITKGDANNVVDEPIYRNQVVGKVVRNVNKLGLYIKVFTDVKVIILLFFIIMLSAYISSEIETGTGHSEESHV